MAKEVISTALVLVILLIVFAAFDDITTGNESNNLGEYLTIGLSIPTLVSVLYYLRK